MIRVGVLGADGRMGTAVCHTVDDDPELELAVRLGSGNALDNLTESAVDVAVDFTTPGAVKANALFCLEHGIHAVIGTTGLSQDDLRELEGKTGTANLFVAPNFAIGAVLMMRFAAQAAPHFQSAEIVERHREDKLDAPSGTSLRTASLMSEVRGRPWKSSDAASEALSGSRGGDAAGVRIHSLRVGGSVAHQEVILGNPGETLTIRHDSLDRASFMPGVLLAIKSIGARPGLTIGLEHLLDL